YPEPWSLFPRTPFWPVVGTFPSMRIRSPLTDAIRVNGEFSSNSLKSIPSDRFGGKVQSHSHCVERGDTNKSIYAFERVSRWAFHQQYSAIHNPRTQTHPGKSCQFCAHPPADSDFLDPGFNPQSRNVGTNPVFIEKHSVQPGIKDETNRMTLHLYIYCKRLRLRLHISTSNRVIDRADNNSSRVVIERKIV